MDSEDKSSGMFWVVTTIGQNEKKWMESIGIVHFTWWRYSPWARTLSLLSVSESGVSSRACDAERGRLDDISMQIMGQEAE